MKRPRVLYKREEKDELLLQMQDRLEKLQIKEPARPLNRKGEPLDPALPDDLTRLNDEQLGRLHGEFCAMAAYVVRHLAVSAVQTAIARRVDNITRARVRFSKSGTRDDKAAAVEVDRRVKKTGHELTVQHGVETFTKAMLDGYIIGRDACSREQTRRQTLVRDPRSNY